MSETQITDLSRLMLKDPREISDQDLDLIIKDMREKRKKFIFDDISTTGRKAPRKIAKEKSEIESIADSIKIEDIKL